MLPAVSLLALVACRLAAQTTGATFGEVVKLGGTPSDLVLDESRASLYLVNQNANRVDVYDYAQKQVVKSFSTGSTPVAAAISMDAQYLYVSNNASSTMTVIDLKQDAVWNTVSLPAKPEGLEVGADGRVLITTEGTSTTDQVTSLLLYDRQAAQSQVTPVAFAPPPPTPSPLPATIIGRPVTTFRGKLIRTPDGNYIIGMSTVNSNAQTLLFVYEVSSASILRSRTVTGQSTVLSIAPDGSRFMAGFTLYDTATLDVAAQQNAANVPFPLSSTGTATFSTLQNVGGSTFTPDGNTIYSAFNVAPFSTPAPRPQASTLLVSNAQNLGVQLGIKIPESIVAKMAIASTGADAWGLSESGLIHLPLSALYDYPILATDTTAVFLHSDDCNRGLATATVGVTNLGKGKLTFSVPDTTAALIAQATSGVAPSSIQFTMDPGRTNVTRQYGTNLYSGGATNSGTALAVNLSSPEAINVPPTILVYMNLRQSDQRGVVYPVKTVPTTAEGLQDVLVDEARDRVYVLNSGYNQIEVFDRTAQAFADPIPVGQLPHQMAMSGDGTTLYVADTGGERIDIVNLDTKLTTGAISFPPVPRSGAAAPITPQALATGIFGLQTVMSNGSQWKVVGGQATVRPAGTVAPTLFTAGGANGPVRMAPSGDGRSIVAMTGNGNVYLYDSLADAYTATNRPYTSTTIQGYYGPLAAAPDGSYYLANGFVLGSSLSPVGGADSPSSTTALPVASKRNVAAVAPLDPNRFIRLTTPVKQLVSSTTTSDSRATLELVDLSVNSVSVIGALAENPPSSVFGTARVNVPPRQIAVDSSGTAYILTLSGLTVVPLTPAGASRPQLASGASALINANDGTPGVAPGGFVAVNGSNLASAGVASQFAVPTVLGGSCVTLSDVALPLLQTSGGQIIAQVPGDLAPGQYVMRVRSLATGQESDAVVVTVQKR